MFGYPLCLPSTVRLPPTAVEVNIDRPTQPVEPYTHMGPLIFCKNGSASFLSPSMEHDKTG